jgi:predicted RNase H-like HicB family nuclease
MRKYSYKIKEGNFGKEIYVKDGKSGEYTVFFDDFPEIVTEGETIKEAQKRLWNATYDTLKHLLKKDI